MIARVDRSAVELLIFMCVNKLLAGTGDSTGMIYPAEYGSGENSPPMMGMGILAVPNFYGGDGSGVTIPDGDLPIAILSLNQYKPCVSLHHHPESGARSTNSLVGQGPPVPKHRQGEIARRCSWASMHVHRLVT